MHSTPAVLTLDEAARLLAVSRRTLHRWIASGRAPVSVKEGPTRGARRVIVAAGIALWLDERSATRG